MLWSFLTDSNFRWIFRALWLRQTIHFYQWMSAVRQHIKVTPPPVGNYQDLHIHLRKVAVHRPRDDLRLFLARIHFSLTFPLCLSRCYRCHCPPQFDGPDCQQTRLSFLGNGYAWLPPIRPCFDSHLSLEFMTDEDDGLLLYTGPLATLLPGDTEDYMAIGNRFLPLWASACEW